MLRTPPRPLRAHFAWVAFLAAAIGAAPVFTTLASPKTPQAENEKPEVAIDVAVREIERISNDVANGRKYFDTDLRPIVIRVSLSPDDGLLYFDTDARLGPEAGYTDMVDMQNAIEGRAEDLIKALSAGNEPSWRFGGRDTGWWLDEGLGRHKSGSIPSRRPKRSPQATDVSPAPPGPLVVAGGHGFYYHYGQKRWTSHRDKVNDVLEDDITQSFADELHAQLSIKRVASTNLRRMTRDSSHPGSGLAWSRLGARYHLEALYPDLQSVWNTQPDSTQPDRERRQDIRSRPLYANHVNAVALLNIHTNADENLSATGARVFVAPGRKADEKLASLLLCGMEELVHSVADFSGYRIPSSPLTSKGHGETMLAEIPSVIVEVGFHTNPDDVKYLTNPLFKYKAMAGVAKGYRLYRDGKTCGKFTIESDQSTDVVVWGRGKLPIAFGGNPDFPIKVSMLKLDCPSCQPEQHSIWDPPELSRFSVQHGCRPEDLDRSPIRYQVVAVDSFGVKSNEVTYSFNCKPRGAGAMHARAVREVTPR